MWGWLTKIFSWLPGIGSILKKTMGESDEAQRIHAQVELEEARAFKQGRVAPRYVKGYVICGVAIAIMILVVVDAIYPDAIDLPSIDDIARALRTLFSAED